MFHHTGIDRAALDEDAVKVVTRLRHKGHQAFLVGGCVRDLLLRRTPKDFDVATSARPRQIKSLFRNCRIIGRRFKLAHLYFENKILEVSTFRRPPIQPLEEDDGDLLITSDNAFGSASEDAVRRDFTINGLFLDPESCEIHDFVCGIPDIGLGRVRTIGDPLTRIKEDPVRILRAIKFASRLGLTVEENTWEAMCEASQDLSRSAAPRVLEEILRLLRSGNALRAFQMLRDCGAMNVLIPELQSFLERVSLEKRTAFWRMLEAMDSLVRGADTTEGTGGTGNGPLLEEQTTPVLLGCLFLLVFEEDRGGDGERDAMRETDLGRIAEERLAPILRRLNLSRAETSRLKKLCIVHRRFTASGRSRGGFRMKNFLRQDYFAEALVLFMVRCIAEDRAWEEFDQWRSRYESSLKGGDGAEAARSADGAPKSRKREAGRGERDAPARKAAGRRAATRQAAGPKKAEKPTRTARSKEAKRGPRKATATRKKARTERARKPRLKRRREEPLPPPLPEIDLDPSEVPTYGSVLGDTGSADKVELEGSKSKRTRKRMAKVEEPYVPPPPPEDEPAEKRDEPDDSDTFGDW
ncbi:MAG: polynucleotide adenylyltransferase PcnB [Planctomycetota bacterium]